MVANQAAVDQLIANFEAYRTNLALRPDEVEEKDEDDHKSTAQVRELVTLGAHVYAGLATVTTNKLVLQPYNDKHNINYFTNDSVPWGYVRAVKSYLIYLEKYISDNNIEGINYVATKIFISQSLLTCEILRNSTNEVIEIIYDAAAEMDRLASQVLQQLPQDVIEMDIIKSIVAQLTELAKFTDINYITYAIFFFRDGVKNILNQ
ncbi:hypothetical protein QE152_g23221 [Popillia japonica]|uniref:Uncharacterized protein n=1 Tax=Popillia japonica TaxID=7064 RepID=A0AAW1KHV0_POPJA